MIPYKHFSFLNTLARTLCTRSNPPLAWPGRRLLRCARKDRLSPGRRLLRMGVHKHPRSQRQTLMSLRGGRQADEAIPPLTWPGRRLLRCARKDRLSPGRRLLRCARKDIKDIKACLCEEAVRPTKQSPLPPGRGGDCFAALAMTFFSPGRRLLRSARNDIPFAGEEIASLRSQRHSSRRGEIVSHGVHKHPRSQ